MNKAFLLIAACALPGLNAETARTLPNSTRWEFPVDIVAEQYSELRTFYEREIAKAAAARSHYWAGEAWNAVVRENREHFRRMLGATDPLLEPKPQKTVLAESPSHTVSMLEWPVLPVGNMGATARGSVRAYAVLIVPKSSGPHPAAIVISDAAQSAADLAGLTRALPPAEQTARRLASAGYVVLAPFFVQRRTFCQPWTEDRSWLFRLGYQVGRHLVGTEVQQVTSAVTLLRGMSEVDGDRVAVVGEKQGALTALYAAALDERIRAAVAANYFGTREKAFEEPEDRTLWKHLIRFGDAEVAGMIAPRALIIDGAVPGTDTEIRRAEGYYARTGEVRPIRATSANAGSISNEAIAALAKVLNPASPAAADYTAALPPERLAQIANTQFQYWQARLRNLAMEAYAVRQA
ncbi:MAG TPA: dienelactone hydrolase family protein, partial [Bryobacteraceae bacterium]|nr:dienelactone hydrolase family protein [Bryobacteraceae bacterium]